MIIFKNIKRNGTKIFPLKKKEKDETKGILYSFLMGHQNRSSRICVCVCVFFFSADKQKQKFCCFFFCERSRATVCGFLAFFFLFNIFVCRKNNERQMTIFGKKEKNIRDPTEEGESGEHPPTSTFFYLR
jgi:Na+/melibiose symporter-like transporter